MATAVAALAACFLASQSAALSLLVTFGAECCCAHRDAHCRCKVCEHARELASGQPCLKSCGASSPDRAVLAHSDPVVPVPAPGTSVSLPLARVEPRIAAPPSDPPFEVPTPPPLAAT